MNIERLRLTQDALRGIDPEHFNLEHWMAVSDGDEEEEFTPHLTYEQVEKLGREAVTMRRLLRIDCGSIGCAVGWAASNPRIREQGLELRVYDDDAVLPYYDGQWNWSAVHRFFDIDSYTSTRIFSDESYRSKATPQDVIERIDEVIAKHATA